MPWLYPLVVLFFLSACGQVSRPQMETPDLTPLFAEMLETTKNQPPVDYRQQVKPILEQRCVVCHGCYDAPCQLKLSAYEGLARGGSKQEVYDGTRLISTNLTRLFEDAKTNGEWREKGFFPVLNEAENSVRANLENSVMAGMLALKQLHPLPDEKHLPESFDLKLDRDQQCPKQSEFAGFSANYPLWGMPYGLPGLADDEYRTLLNWLAQGAEPGHRRPLSNQIQQRISAWEDFLNSDALKHQLMSRYLFEHLFVANLYFEDLDRRVFFKLVRSATPPGESIERIVTRRPYDDPGVDRVYYRLARVKTTILAKTHLPYALSPARLVRLSELFIQPDYPVTRLPSYAVKVASNPFIAFSELPVDARYRFLLDDARHFINGFIKGPVCRGQVALNVINDHFWVFFIDPDSPVMQNEGNALLLKESNDLRLPAQDESNSIPLLSWLKYARSRKAYLQEKREYMREQFPDAGDVNIDLTWRGNSNAALTVFRHFDSATVVEGLVGENPKTAWAIGYALFERIHYLLVAGFDVYGNAGHQLNTRLYMDFLRMDGEFNFLMLLSREVRREQWDYWYRGAHDKVKEFIDERHLNFDQDTGITYLTDNPKSELFGMLKEYLGEMNASRYRLDKVRDGQMITTQMERLQRLDGLTASLLPQISFMEIRLNEGESRYYTLIHNNAHINITHMFKEEKARLPEEDTLTVVPGFIGAYPNSFLRIDHTELPLFVDQVEAISNEADYSDLLDRFGIRRTSGSFWDYSDRLHTAYRKTAPVESGLFDYNRLDNR